MPIDHLHKLISPLSIEFIRMELRLHYVYWCILIFWQVDYCLLKPQKRFQLNCCHNNHWKTWLKVASYCFLKSGENANICILKIFPLGERGWCVHVFLVLYFKIDRPHDSKEGFLKDFCDGDTFISHSLFSVSDTALQLLIFYDDLELCKSVIIRFYLTWHGM